MFADPVLLEQREKRIKHPYDYRYPGGCPKCGEASDTAKEAICLNCVWSMQQVDLKLDPLAQLALDFSDDPVTQARLAFQFRSAYADGRLAPGLAKMVGYETGKHRCPMCGLSHWTFPEAVRCCQGGYGKPELYDNKMAEYEEKLESLQPLRERMLSRALAQAQKAAPPGLRPPTHLSGVWKQILERLLEGPSYITDLGAGQIPAASRSTIKRMQERGLVCLNRYQVVSLDPRILPE